MLIYFDIVNGKVKKDYYSVPHYRAEFRFGRLVKLDACWLKSIYDNYGDENIEKNNAESREFLFNNKHLIKSLYKIAFREYIKIKRDNREIHEVYEYMSFWSR